MKNFELLVIATILSAFGVSLRLDAQSVVRGPYLQTLTPNGVIVRWRTDVPTDSVVRFGAAPGALNQSVMTGPPDTEHIVAVNGLSPNTKYFYSIGSSAAVLAGDASDHFFVTAPTVGTKKSTRAWVVGDSGRSNATSHAIRDQFLAYTGLRDPDLMILLGDNAYEVGSDMDYQMGLFQNQYETILRKCVVWPAMGNHDEITASSTNETGGYYDIFSLPRNGEAGGVPSNHESYFSFDYGNVHFICLNSALTNVTILQNMYNWLLQDLAANTADWTIAFWHHPPYSKGSHDSDTEFDLALMRQFFVPVLEAGGVDLVMCGHSHGYERTPLLDGHYNDSSTFNPAQHVLNGANGSVASGGSYRKPAGTVGRQGCVYVVCGCSATVSSAPYNHPAMLNSLQRAGSMILDVVDQQLDLAFMDDGGVILDEFTMTKDNVTPIARRRTLVPSLSNWRFDHSGTDLGTNWRSPAFDDSAWNSGMGPFGFGEPYINTTLTSGFITYYFRTTFQLDIDPLSIELLRLSLAYDDGCVVYLNGTEVARLSLPSGNITAATTAMSHEATRYETLDLNTLRHLLNVGVNTLAIEVHQSSASSNDLVFDAALVAERFGPLLGPCAEGAITGPMGTSLDLLEINMSTGGVARSVDVPVSTPITLNLADPPAFAAAPFALFARVGTPSPLESISFGSVGAFCFTPQPLNPSDPSLLVLTSSLGTFGSELLPPTLTPFSFTYPGLPVPVDLTFQGAVFQSATELRVTNAVRLNVIP